MKSIIFALLLTATMVWGQSRVIVENSVVRPVPVQGNVGLTNATITYADIGSNGMGSAVSIPLFTKSPIGTNAVGGFTLVTNLTIVSYLGTDLAAGDSMVTNGIEVANVGLTSGAKSILLCATYSASTNTYGVSGIDMLITDRPLTWATASAAAALANSELPYVLGSISFGTNSTGNGREWNVFGNAMTCSQVGQNIGIKPATNSIFLYFKCRAAMTNAANDYIKLTISQDLQ